MVLTEQRCLLKACRDQGFPLCLSGVTVPGELLAVLALVLQARLEQQSQGMKSAQWLCPSDTRLRAEGWVALIGKVWVCEALSS